MRAVYSKAWIVLVNAFWIVVWMPRGERLRFEDVTTILVLRSALYSSCVTCGLRGLRMSGFTSRMRSFCGFVRA
jgi:hypothetical protein